MRWIHAVCLIALLLASTVIQSAQASAEAIIRLDHSSNRHPGETVKVSGTTSLEEVAVKVVRPDSTIAYVDFAGVSGGSFSVVFSLPAGAALGTYTVVAGKGTDVATDTFEVVSAPSTGDGSVTPVPTPAVPTPQPTPSAGSPGSVGSSGKSVILNEKAILLRQAAAAEGRTAVTASVQADALRDAFANLPSKSGDAAAVIVAVKGDFPILRVELPAAALADASVAPDTVVLVQGDRSAYRLPVRLPALQTALRSLGAQGKDAKVIVAMEQVSGQMRQQIQNAANKAGVALRGGGVDYRLILEANGKTVEIADFGGTFVSRTLTIDGAIDASHATAVRFDPEKGAFTFVPSLFETVEGATVVTIKRNGNSIYTVVEAAKSFGDLAGHWAKGDIETLASKLIVNGQSPDRFEPERSITRAEFTAMLVRGIGMTESRTPASFADVPAEGWFAGAVSAAEAAELVEGSDGGMFRPDAPISREQMAVLAARTLRIVGGAVGAAMPEEQPAEAAFADSRQAGDWARPGIAQAKAARIMDGYPDGTFRPAENVSRAQAAVVLKRMLAYAGYINK